MRSNVILIQHMRLQETPYLCNSQQRNQDDHCSHFQPNLERDSYMFRILKFKQQ